MFLVGITLLGRSVGKGSDKTAPWPSRLGVALGEQPYLIKNCTATETPGRKKRDTTAWGVDGPQGQRPMTHDNESQVDLEAARPKWLLMWRTPTTGPGL